MDLFNEVPAVFTWTAAAGAATAGVATIWRVWLRHVFRAFRLGLEAVIEMRDLLKTELRLPGDDRDGSPARASLRDDLIALADAQRETYGVLRDVVRQLGDGAARFAELDARLAALEARVTEIASAHLERA